MSSSRDRLLVPLLLVVACSTNGHVAAQQADACEDDTDCKDDRICEDATCVSPDQLSTTGTPSSSSGDHGGGGGSSSAGGSCAAPFDPAAPSFLSFGTSVTTLHEGQSVVFTAVVTD